ncbi:edd domain family [Lasius niger]|uniref:Edd domain family n=1 Tax=Lasius niger TaxID=67767 RepID=A0A0J7KCN5_LASNI|nr:edd domain family [Lasius niger]
MIRFFQELNAPFVSGGIEPDPNQRGRILENFVTKYLALATKSEDSQDSELAFVLHSMIKGLAEDEDCSDMLQRYLQCIVPYVKQCCDEPPIQSVEIPADACSARRFHHVSQTSVLIRSKWARYSALFEVPHVMAYCCVSGEDTEVVANFAYDLLARLCRGHFDGGGGRYEHFLLSTLNRDLRDDKCSRLMRSMMRGESLECFSSTFLEGYARLHNLVEKKFLARYPNDHFAFSTNFPYVLFKGRTDDYLGFVSAMAFVLDPKNNNNNGTLNRESVYKGKRIYDFVLRFIAKMRNFVGETTEECFFWTADMFQLFICADRMFEDELKNLLQVLG